MQIQSPVFSRFKELFIRWKESFELLTNKRFWLVTIKGTVETYQILFKKFWWLMVLAIGFDFFVRGFFNEWCHNGDMICLNLYKIMNLIWFLLWCLVGAVLFLIVRSSLERKDYAYFLQNWKSYIWFIVVTGIIWFLRSYGILYAQWLVWVVHYFFFLSNFFFISTVYFSPFLVLYTFFYLDSKKTTTEFIRRLWSTTIMVFYTYPLCLIVWCFITFVSFLIVLCGQYIFDFFHISGHLGGIMLDTMTKLLLPGYFCLLYMLYTKQVHEQYDRYA